jgi:hypothetical protein
MVPLPKYPHVFRELDEYSERGKIMHHSIATDLIILWLVAIVLALTWFAAWGFSIHDGGVEDTIAMYIAPLILLAALIITLLKVVGVIGIWF